jgi:hypothetical protein
MEVKDMLKKLRSQGYKGVSSINVFSGRTRVHLILADAKKSAPIGNLSAYAYPKRKIHVASYVPSTRRTFTFSKKFAQKSRR